MLGSQACQVAGDLNLCGCLCAGVAGSAQLTDAFRRLGIGTVWREALNSEEWSRKMDHGHIVELTAALKDERFMSAANLRPQMVIAILPDTWPFSR